MADKMTPAVTITLDKERHLLLTLSAMIAFKKETGKDLMNPEVVKQISEHMELEDLRALLWASLRHEDKNLTIEQVGDMLHIGNMKDVAAKLGEAWSSALPEAKKEAPLAPSPLNG